MANLTSVYKALTDKITAALAGYGVPVEVYAGWPEQQELQEHLNTHRAHVSIALHGSGKRVDMPIGQAKVTPPDIQVTATVSGTFLTGGAPGVAATGTVTLAGTVTDGVRFMVELAGGYVPYTAPIGATLADIATGLAAAVNAAGSSSLVTATAAGPVLTLTAVAADATGNAIPLGFRIGGEGSIVTQIRQQQDEIWIHVWAWNDYIRMSIGDLIDEALSDIRFLSADDGSPIRVLYKGNTITDQEIRIGIYRRILHYTVEYNMTRSAGTYTVLEGLVTLDSEA